MNGPPPPSVPAAPRLSAELLGHGKRILHLDDEPAVTLSVRRLLEKLGYSVASFNSPPAALAHFRDGPRRFDLVLTDLLMPGMTGLQFAAAVLAVHPGMPVVMFSAFSDGYDADAIRQAGIREVILKPAGLIPIAETIRRAIDLHAP